MTHQVPRIPRVLRRLGVLCGIVLCVSSASSCGYTLAGRGSFLPAYIKTIGVPSFTNHTNIFNFETQLTQKVRSEFIGRGKYKIVPDETGVDALLVGDIVSATVVPVSLGNTGLQTGAAVTVTANVQLKSLRDNTIIWQNAALSIREQYDTLNASSVTGGAAQSAADPSAFFAQNTTALDRLSTNFARTIVSGILEAF